MNCQFAHAEGAIALLPAGQTQPGRCGGFCAEWHCLLVRAMILGGLVHTIDDAET